MNPKSIKKSLYIGIGVSLIWVAYLFLNAEFEMMDDRVRGARTTVQTRWGKTHLEYKKSTGPVVVMLHGASGPMDVWDKAVSHLFDIGYSTLRYDLYGRGYSDRVDRDYDLNLYVDQLQSVLKNLNVDAPVILIGSSMGCIVASEFTSRFPERVAKLILIGPAGFPIKANPASKLLAIPFIGEYMIGILGNRLLPEHNKKYFAQPSNAKTALDAFTSQLKYRGTKKAILSTMRNMPMQDYRSGYAKIGKLEKPVLVIWGEKDATFPYAYHEAMQELIPQSQLIPVADAAHLPQFETPKLTNAAIANFLSGN